MMWSSKPGFWSMVHTIVFREHIVPVARNFPVTAKLLYNTSAVFRHGMQPQLKRKVHNKLKYGKRPLMKHATHNHSNRSSSRGLNTQQESLCQKSESFSATDMTFQCACITLQITVPYNPIPTLYKHGRTYVIRYALC